MVPSFPFEARRLPLVAVPAVPRGDRGPAAHLVNPKMSGCETRLTAIVLDEATIASTHALSNHRSAEPIDKEQGGAAGENVSATKRGFQGVTWNRNANDPVCLRALGLNQLPPERYLRDGCFES